MEKRRGLRAEVRCPGADEAGRAREVEGGPGTLGNWRWGES